MQNTLIRWKSDFWTYTAEHTRLASRSTLQATNDDALRSSHRYVYYLTNVQKIIRRCYSR